LGTQVLKCSEGMGLAICISRRDLSTDLRTGVVRRHHIDLSIVKKSIKVAAHRAGLTRRISAYTSGTVLPPTCCSAASICASSKPY
jgi:hypothetical protein